jgi:hypothetical protein
MFRRNPKVHLDLVLLPVQVKPDVHPVSPTPGCALGVHMVGPLWTVGLRYRVTGSTRFRKSPTSPRGSIHKVSLQRGKDGSHGGEQRTFWKGFEAGAHPGVGSHLSTFTSSQ